MIHKPAAPDVTAGTALRLVRPPSVLSIDTTDLTTAIINFTGARTTLSVLARKEFASVEIATPSQSGPLQAAISDRDRIFTNGYQSSEQVGDNMAMGNPTVNDNRMSAAN